MLAWPRFPHKHCWPIRALCPASAEVHPGVQPSEVSIPLQLFVLLQSLKHIGKGKRGMLEHLHYDECPILSPTPFFACVCIILNKKNPVLAHADEQMITWLPILSGGWRSINSFLGGTPGYASAEYMHTASTGCNKALCHWCSGQCQKNVPQEQLVSGRRSGFSGRRKVGRGWNWAVGWQAKGRVWLRRWDIES